MEFRGKRDRRERAALAVIEAKRAELETQKLARRLSSAARAELQQVAASVHEEILRAGRDIRRRPGRARRRAGRAEARLARASLATPTGGRCDGDRRAGASGADAAKARSKLIKRRRAEAKQAQQMAKIVAAQMAVAAAVTSADASKG